MSDNPLIEGFLKLHEAGGIGGGMSGTKFSNAASYAPAVRAGVLGAVNNFTMGAVTNPEAQNNFPLAYKGGEIGATVAALATGVVGVGKALAGTVAKNTGQTIAKIAKNAGPDDFQLGSKTKNTLNLTPQMLVPPKPLNLTPQMLVPPKPLNLTPQMRVPKLRTEEENDSSKGNNEMSTNPYIKGFFDIEEARAKNTNIFDESKKLTAAAAAAEYDGEYGDKRKIVIPKNRQGEITQFTGLHTVKTQKPYKKEVDFDDADYTHRVGGYYNDKPVSLNVRAKSKEEAQRIASEQFKNFRPTIVKQLTNEGLDENAFNQLGQKKPVGDILPAPAKGVVPKHGKKFKEGDIVVPHAGPHAGVKHKVVFARKGSVNMIPLGISAKEDKYDSATVRANHEHLSPYIAEEADLDEAKKAKPGHNASVMANKAAILTKFLKKKNEDEDEKIDEANILPSNFSDRTTPLPDKILYAIDKENSKKKKPVSLKKAPFDMKKEEVEFSEEEIDFINNVMEAMPVAPTSENDSPNPTPKRNAEGSRAKGSMAD